MKIDEPWYDTDTRGWKNPRVKGGKQKSNIPNQLCSDLIGESCSRVDMSHDRYNSHGQRFHQWRGGELDSTVHPRRPRV
jgi:hypothetical protein